MVIKKSSAENRQSRSGVPSEQLVESWEDGVESSVAGYSPDSNDVSTKAEESPLLRSVTRKRLVNTVQKNNHCWELLLSNA
jgi:hypothetical protein